MERGVPVAQGPAVLWRPAPADLERATLTRYLAWLAAERGHVFEGYQDLWRWSTDDLSGFWGSVWDFFGLSAVSAYDEVLADDAMPGARWFTGARLNFAERCLATGRPDDPALIAVAEDGVPVTTTYAELRRQVAAVAGSLRRLGVRPGDCVAGYLPNVPEAVVALLATAAVGAVWTVTSPDFGTSAARARLGQAEPRVLFCAESYRYGGRVHDRHDAVAELVSSLPGLRHVVVVGRPDAGGASPDGWPGPSRLPWDELVADSAALEFADVAFDHPLWVLWSSGTTGVPKGIVHGHGGITVELLKALGLAADVQRDDRFFFVTSTSWMVWNFLLGGLLLGAAVVLYDGSPTYPELGGAWRVAEVTRATVMGTGAAYLTAGHKAGDRPRERYDLSALRSLLQTGSTLPTPAWNWVSRDVRPGIWLQSVCGGTDVCSALAGASPLEPVRAGCLQAPALGVALAAWDADGRPVIGREGELVVTRPMPSMPLRFLGDADGSRYRDAYFRTYPGIWRHGDFVTVRDDGSIVVSGRSDATLNRLGIRMGPADLYAVVEAFDEIADSLVVGVDRPDGGYFMPLFVVLAPGRRLDDDLRARLVDAVRDRLSPRHVPDAFVQIDAVPRTSTGKKLEVPVKRILEGASVAESGGTGALNPHALDWFARFATELSSEADRS
jgi:acetoacetyl-CoA synthetase